MWLRRARDADPPGRRTDRDDRVDHRDARALTGRSAGAAPGFPTCSSPPPTAAPARPCRARRRRRPGSQVALLRGENAHETPFEQPICLLASNTDFPAIGSWPRLRPRPVGSRRVARRQAGGGDAGARRRALGRHRDLLRGDRAARPRRQLRPDESGPTWSPDGRSIAFARGNGGLWVASATGAAGSERRILASGIQPVWVRGGGPPRLTGPQRPRRQARPDPGGGRAARGARSACSAGPVGAGARSRRAGRAGR